MTSPMPTTVELVLVLLRATLVDAKSNAGRSSLVGRATTTTSPSASAAQPSVGSTAVSSPSLPNCSPTRSKSACAVISNHSRPGSAPSGFGITSVMRMSPSAGGSIARQPSPSSHSPGSHTSGQDGFSAPGVPKLPDAPYSATAGHQLPASSLAVASYASGSSEVDSSGVSSVQVT